MACPAKLTAHPQAWQLRAQTGNLYAAARSVNPNGRWGRFMAESSRSAGLIEGPAPRVNTYTQTSFTFSEDGRQLLLTRRKSRSRYSVFEYWHRYHLRLQVE